MPVLFMNAPGRAVALVGDPGDAGVPIALDDISGSWFAPFSSILTDLSLALSGNFQFTHTCKDVVYAYVFGRRISALRIGGMAFASTCDAGGGGPTGIEQVVDYYNGNNIAARATPLQIQIGISGAGRFRGFLTDLRAEIVKPEARLSQFALVFAVFPTTT